MTPPAKKIHVSVDVYIDGSPIVAGTTFSGWEILSHLRMGVIGIPNDPQNTGLSPFNEWNQHLQDDLLARMNTAVTSIMPNPHDRLEPSLETTELAYNDVITLVFAVEVKGFS